MKVWVVGEADDHIEAAFTTEAAATTYLEARQSSVIVVRMNTNS